MEFSEFKKKFDDVVTIKMVRDGSFDNGLVGDEKSHITETEISDYNNFDYIIKNDGFDSLREQAHEIVKREEM